MKAAMASKPLIRIAVVASDPLRLVGFRALFDSESGFELVSASLPDIGGLQSIDLVLLSNGSVQKVFDLIGSLKATRPDLRIIATGQETMRQFSKPSSLEPRATSMTQPRLPNLYKLSES